jgi:hypothetical protein
MSKLWVETTWILLVRCAFFTMDSALLGLGPWVRLLYGARFSAGGFTRGVPLRFTPLLLQLKRCHACDQLHSSRVFTPLTGSHCKFRPNTEGLFCFLNGQCLSDVTINSATTLMTSHNPAGILFSMGNVLAMRQKTVDARAKFNRALDVYKRRGMGTHPQAKMVEHALNSLQNK